MTRLRFALGALIVLVAAAMLLALGSWLPARGPVRPLDVPGGDREIAWLHTSTNANNWERFVAGVHRVPGFEVDDSRAFLDQTTAIPEVVLSRPGVRGKLRIRWYKLTSEAGTRAWVQALARRDPPPLAVIGGGSTDRAVTQALALHDQTDWRGKPPLFLITTATANEVYLEEEPSAASATPPALRTPVNLMQVYPGRTFRFCFTNEQMARAVIDFVWQTPDLRPQNGYFSAVGVLGTPAAVLATGGGPLARVPLDQDDQPARIFALQWDDDPYSVDLAEHFRRVVHETPPACPVQVSRQGLPYSIGRFDQANHWEAEAVAHILQELPTGPGQRSMLVLPTIAPPARRVLRAFTGAAPLVGKSLVAVTGDGIALNLLYRDADIAWPIRDIPIPLVAFTHQNPIAWEQPQGPPTAVGGALPTSTDDVLLFAELVRRAANATFTDDGGLVPDSDALAERMRTQEAPFFDAEGNRIGGKGEYVICVRPRFGDNGKVASSALIEVWHRHDGKRWDLVGRLTR